MWWLLLLGIVWGKPPERIREGVALTPSYTGEVWASSAGALAHAGSADLELALDLEALAGLTGSQVLVYGVANHSTPPSSLLGDAQWTSNIEAPNGWRCTRRGRRSASDR